MARRADSSFASRSAFIAFRRDWMWSAWISGFGLKNSLRIGNSSFRIHRIGPRCDSKSVSSSNAKFGSSGGSYAGCVLRN